jgi:hypothetical protein
MTIYFPVGVWQAPVENYCVVSTYLCTYLNSAYLYKSQAITDLISLAFRYAKKGLVEKVWLIKNWYPAVQIIHFILFLSAC